MPDFDHEIIDPHIHLFDVHGTPRPTQQFVRLFGWNERLLRAMLKRMFPKPTVSFFGERTSLVNDYLTSEYRADSVTSEVGRYVHVQAGWKDKTPMDAVGETEWLESLADPPAAIVAHADLQQGSDIAPVLAAHTRASGRTRGIRHMLAHHRADGLQLTFPFNIGHIGAHLGDIQTASLVPICRNRIFQQRFCGG